MEVVAAGISRGGIQMDEGNQGIFWTGVGQSAAAMSGVTLLMPCYSLLAIMDQVIAGLVCCGIETDTRTLHGPA